MKRFLDSFTRRSQPSEASFDEPLSPGEPLAVIGDVHGRDDLLARILAAVKAQGPNHRIVLVGDLIDRGENSASVLRLVSSRPDLVVVRGNHEAMCLEFLDEPEQHGPRWLQNGGLQTLASFGVGGITERSGRDVLWSARDRLAEAMGGDLIAWLRALPLAWQSGNVVVTHAGADPRRSIEDQEEEALLWGNPLFGQVPRGDGLWVVHGHVIRPAPVLEPGRIGVDTGAYATGRLTAALIEEGKVQFGST